MKRGKKNSDVMTINVGIMIAEKIKEQKIYKTDIAKKMGRQETAMIPILKRPSVQTYLLWEISEAIGHNFFHEIAEALDEKTKDTLTNGKQKEKQKIAELEKENEKLKLEVEILKEIVKGKNGG